MVIMITSIRLVTSNKDMAGKNIQEYIEPKARKEITVFKNDSIYSDDELAKCTKSDDSIIFLSRHSARSLRPSFTVHAIGNFNEAVFGGKPSTLVHCNSFLLKQLLMNINQLVESEEYQLSHAYEVSIEATHHGPFSSVPVAFIEVGSSETQWADKEACRLIADAVNLLLLKGLENENNWVSAIGFGGNHYSSKFSKLVLDTGIALGHVCAKYAVPHLSADLVDQMIAKTTPAPSTAFFDKKSLKRKQEIRNWLEKYELEVIQV